MWILVTQTIMGAVLLPIVFLDFQVDFATIYPLLVLHAFAAATQDVSVDALCISVVPVGERGSINGLMQAGMLTGRSLLGGGALVLGEKIGDNAVIAVLIAVVWSSTVLLLTAAEDVPAQEAQSEGRFNKFFATLQSAFSQRRTWLGLLFAAIGGAGFEAVGAVAGPYLIDRNFSGEEVGFFFALPVIAGMIGGALIGGYVSDRIGRRRAVSIFLGLLAVMICMIAFVDFFFGQPAHWWLFGLMSFFYLCVGFFTASSYALFMDLTDPKLAATQFSAFMGATNGCESWASLAGGRLVGGFGYPVAFVLMATVSLLGLPLLGGMSESKLRKHAA
jgi:MFS family permease